MVRAAQKCALPSQGPFSEDLESTVIFFYLFINYIFKIKMPFEMWDKRAQLVRTDMLFALSAALVHRVAWPGLVSAIQSLNRGGH